MILDLKSEVLNAAPPDTEDVAGGGDGYLLGEGRGGVEGGQHGARHARHRGAETRVQQTPHPRRTEHCKYFPSVLTQCGTECN